MKTQWHNNWSV